MAASRKAALVLFSSLSWWMSSASGSSYPCPQADPGTDGGDISTASTYGGWLMFSYAVMQFLCAPVLGNLSDRYGRRPVLLFSLLGFGLDYILLALAPDIWWLFAGRIIAGITGASFTTHRPMWRMSASRRNARRISDDRGCIRAGVYHRSLVGGLLGQFGSRVPFYAAASLPCSTGSMGILYCPSRCPPKNAGPSTGSAPTRLVPFFN